MARNAGKRAERKSFRPCFDATKQTFGGSLQNEPLAFLSRKHRNWKKKRKVDLRKQRKEETQDKKGRK